MKTMVFKTFNRKTIARLLRHEDEHGMGRIFMYAFINEVVRQRRPFPFDCESAQVNPNLMIVDKQGRSISVEHRRNRLSLTLNNQCDETLTHIEYKGKAYRQVVLDWLAACIRYTSLQPELRDELSSWHSNMQNLHNSDSRKICECQYYKQHVQKTHKFKHKSNNCLQSHSA